MSKKDRLSKAMKKSSDQSEGQKERQRSIFGGSSGTKETIILEAFPNIGILGFRFVI